MSSSVRPGRVYRPADAGGEVFVLGETARETLPEAGPVADAGGVLAAARERAAAALHEAEARAAAIIAAAEGDAAAVREAGRAQGFAAGRAEAESQLRDYVELARRAAADGACLRDSVAEQSIDVLARAVGLATRRIVGEYYEAAPERTALACAEALRAAAGQEVLCIRVHPGVAAAVQAHLADAAAYVRPDEGVAIGGAIIDLRHGTIDATLDARLSLMELALGEASGGLQP